MACFLVPVAEAIGVTIASGVMKHREKKRENEMSLKAVSGADFLAEENTKEHPSKEPFYKKLNWLSWLLWGGSLLLLLEHIWHGEIVPWFPFFTAAASPEGVMTMLKEMGTVGVAMAGAVTLVWCGMLLVSYLRKRRALAAEEMK
ncbi:MAG: hypothetical protein LUE27_01135 [Clostridia bacterium]|nr:hypothetical protein [Clostridia bacterium]